MPPAAFIEPMLLARAERLPEGANWSYELKLDGYRALAIKCYVQLTRLGSQSSSPECQLFLPLFNLESALQAFSEPDWQAFL